MYINYNDKNNLLNRFPSIDLINENIITKKSNTHKKYIYNSDLYLIIPKGKKCFVWFTYFKHNNVCLLCDLDKSNKITKFTLIKSCFDSTLSLGTGTILYGTSLTYNNTSVFSTENIFYFKGKNISDLKYNKKLQNINELYNNYIKLINYNNIFTVFVIPYIKIDFESALKYCEESIIPIYSIQCRHIKNNYTNSYLIKENKDLIFKVKPSIKDDTYELYCHDSNNNELFFDYALIQDYKTSILMNKLFRNIKENDNLDLLIESDDEDEFENVDEDKYVDMKKELNMRCKYNSTFNKWKPVYVVESNNLAKLNNIKNTKK
tara:strand:+ start:2582 stop:3541 length:960 start_codon:yes stop_codon:yes gene_type:complete